MRLPAIDQDTDRRVRKAVIERLEAEDKENWEFLEEYWPGLKDKSAREKLAYLETLDGAQWINMYAQFPIETLSLMRGFRRLWNEYRQPVVML